MGLFKKDIENADTASTEVVEQTEIMTAAMAEVFEESDEDILAEFGHDEDSDVDSEEILKKYDIESNVRIWEGKPKLIVTAFLIAFSLFCIIMTLGVSVQREMRLALFVGFAIVVGYIVYPVRKKNVRHNYIPWYDIVLMVLGSSCFFFYAIDYEAVNSLMGELSPMHVTIAIVGFIVLVELCRRCVGLPIIFVAGILIVYFFSVRYGKAGDFSTALTEVCSGLFYSTNGILGTPVNACFNFIVMFIIFGAFLERTGIAEFFINLANRIAGWSSGGAAKVAVISSALCGMVSGSSVGNTVTTGSVTIPMMKKAGYKPEFAGAVEAASSTGGQIMPPIMGAAAFLMVEYSGFPYIEIAAKAVVPAVLYFAGIFITVHLEAKKLGLKGMPLESLPKIKYLITRSYLLIPLVLLVALVSTNMRTMAFSAGICMICAFAVGFINFLTIEIVNRQPEQTIGDVAKDAFKTACIAALDALRAGAQNCIPVTIACAMAGIIAGCIAGTGTTSNLVNLIVGFAQNASFEIGGYVFTIEPTLIGLMLTMLTCIVLGMGVPTTANFAIMATTTAPILIKLFADPVTGVTSDPFRLAAYFFVFYFGIVADITPPVALAAYAGSAIAKATPMRTAVNAARIAIAAFLVPYILMYNPAMLFMGDDTTLVIQSALLPETLYVTIPVITQGVQIILTSLVGLFGVAASLNGHLFCKINPLLRILLAAGGICMMAPDTMTDIVGIAIIVIIFIIQRGLGRRERSRAEAEGASS